MITQYQHAGAVGLGRGEFKLARRFDALLLQRFHLQRQAFELRLGGLLRVALGFFDLLQLEARFLFDQLDLAQALL